MLNISIWNLCFLLALIALQIKSIPAWIPAAILAAALILQAVFAFKLASLKINMEKTISQRALNEDEKKFLKKIIKENISVAYLFIGLIIASFVLNIYSNDINISALFSNYYKLTIIAILILLLILCNYLIINRNGFNRDILENKCYTILWKDYYCQIPSYVKFAVEKKLSKNLTYTDTTGYELDIKKIPQTAEVDFCPNTKYILSIDKKPMFVSLILR